MSLMMPLNINRITLKQQRQQQIKALEKRAQNLVENDNTVISYEEFLVQNPIKSQGRLILEMLGMAAGGLALGAVIGGGYDLISGSSLTPILCGSIGGFIGLFASVVSEEAAQNLPIARYEKYLNKKETEYLEKAKSLQMENVIAHDYIGSEPLASIPNQLVNSRLGRT